MQRILGKMRRIIEDYNMIEDNDRIAIGVSGGKDSLIMLTGLTRLAKFLPRKFEIEAVTIDLGFGNFDTSPIEKLCSDLNVNLTIEKTQIGPIVFEARREENPCSLCANMRRGALDNVALRLNCNKVALAHHYDDLVTTAMMSLFYTGRFHTFSPVNYVDRKGLYIIRPMAYVFEKEISSETIAQNLTIVKNPCPADNASGRTAMKNILNIIEKEIPDVKSSIFHAIKRAGINGWK